MHSSQLYKVFTLLTHQSPVNGISRTFWYMIKLSIDFIQSPYSERLRWSKGSVLAFGTQVCGLTPGRSHQIFRAKKSSAHLPRGSKAVGPMS